MNDRVKVDAMLTLHFTLFAVLLCCQYGVGYRVYILPEPGAFCFGVFSGDDCITWTEYSAHPKLADHSTTLIFTPGVYSYGTLSVANIKRFTMIGDGAQIRFSLIFSNIGEVRMHNVTITNNPTINVRNVPSFVMENCKISQAPRSYYEYYYGAEHNVYISGSNLSRIINSAFTRVMIDVYASSTFVVENSIFMNSSQHTTIKGDAYSSVTIYSCRFFNIYAASYGVIYTQGPLEIVDCLFDGNSVDDSGAVVHSMEDVTIRDSRFIRNGATYLSYYYGHYYPRYTRGGKAIRGQRSINIYNCTFSLFTQTSSVIYAYHQYYNNYDQEGLYHVYITDSKFYHSSQSIYSNSNVTIVDSNFSNITSSNRLGGGVVYSTKSVAITNCTFTNSTAIYGDGGVIYSQQWISIADSILVNSLAELGSGGAVYAVQDCTAVNSEFKSCIASNGNGGGIYSGNNVKVINCTMNECSAPNGNGGGIYGGNDVKVIYCTMSECSAPNGTGGAIYSAAKLTDLNTTFESNIVLSKSTFSHNTAECGGVLYTSGHYDHNMEFTDSTFFFNEASGTNTTGGGVGCVENTTLSIKNCIFNKNLVETVGGVLDLSFSGVTIEHSKFSQNRADENGGVFYGQKYSTNFTIAHTIMDHNSAENGGVFYVRRSNSNINITDSKLISNSAGNQGGVMDIRGVTLTMDMDTVITENTAGSSGNVISACVSQITAYGLEARLDPVYPLYCSIYSEGNSSIPQPMSQTISTEESTTMFTTEQTLIGTTGHEGDTESVTMTVSERGTTNEEMATTTTFSPTSTSAATFTSDSPKASYTNSPHEATTSPPSDTTSQLPSDNDATTTESNTQIPTVIASTESQSHTDEVILMTTSVDITTPARVNLETSSSPIRSTSLDNHEGSTTALGTTTATATTMLLSETNNPTHFSRSMDSSVTTDPDRFAVQQVEQNKYDDVWKSSQHNLLQVSITSLMVLCIVCTAVCVMMITLFFIACKRRRGPRLVTRARYKKLSPVDKDLEETQHENVYSFSEI